MRFLIDANLPFKLANLLRNKGYSVIHTDDLPNKEQNTDKEIKHYSKERNLIIVTKDTDFLDSHLIQGIPAKLLLVTTGNIVNKDLIKIFDKHFDSITKLFEVYKLVEIDNKKIIVHEK